MLANSSATQKSTPLKGLISKKSHPEVSQEKVQLIFNKSMKIRWNSIFIGKFPNEKGPKHVSKVPVRENIPNLRHEFILVK